MAREITREELERLRSKLFFFATPCYDGLVTMQYHASFCRLTHLLGANGIPFLHKTIGNESLIPRARNLLAAEFLAHPGATHLFFIDADIEFRSEDIFRMMLSERDVVCGAYPKKGISWESVAEAITRMKVSRLEDLPAHQAMYAVNVRVEADERGRRLVRTDDGFIELLDASTGFMQIRRSVLERMIAAYPDLKYQADQAMSEEVAKRLYALFDTMIDPESRRYLSEDFTFCRRWQQIGGQIHLAPDILLNHVGRYVFPGNIQAIL